MVFLLASSIPDSIYGLVFFRVVFWYSTLFVSVQIPRLSLTFYGYRLYIIDGCLLIYQDLSRVEIEHLMVKHHRLLLMTSLPQEARFLKRLERSTSIREVGLVSAQVCDFGYCHLENIIPTTPPIGVTIIPFPLPLAL